MIFAIVKKELKKMTKEKGIIFWTFLLPILFIVVFAMIFNQTSYTFDIHYIDKDQTKSSKEFIKQIDKLESFKMIKEKNEQEVLEEIKKGKIINFIVIDKNYGKKIKERQTPKITYYYDDNRSSAQETGPVKTLLENIVNGLNKQKIAMFVNSHAGSKKEAESILSDSLNIQDKAVSAKDVNPITQIVPGYTVMFAFFIILTMARTFIGERDNGMLARLYSTSIRPVQYTIGMWIPAIILVLVQITVLLTFGHIQYDLNIGDIGAVSALSFALTLLATSLGLAISFLAKSEQMAAGLTQLITMGGAILGGLWFPIDIMPTFVQQIAHFAPQYWAQTAFIDIMSRNAQINDILPTLGILLIYTIVFFVLALLGFKNFFKGATK